MLTLVQRSLARAPLVVHAPSAQATATGTATVAAAAGCGGRSVLAAGVMRGSGSGSSACGARWATMGLAATAAPRACTASSRLPLQRRMSMLTSLWTKVKQVRHWGRRASWFCVMLTSGEQAARSDRAYARIRARRRWRVTRTRRQAGTMRWGLFKGSARTSCVRRYPSCEYLRRGGGAG